jgi:hypothetical protein
MPSILDFLDIKVKEKLLFGESIFSRNGNGQVFNLSGSQYFLFKPPYLATLQNEKAKTQLQIKSGRFQDCCEGQTELEQELKAWVQYGINGLKTNKSYIPVTTKK